MNEFLTAIHNALGSTPSEIIADGQIRRFSTNGKPDDTAGYYALFDHGGGFFAGFYGCFRKDVYSNWHSKGAAELTPEEKAKFQEAKYRARDELRRKQKEAAQKAAWIWKNSEPAQADHPYLAAKGIPPYFARQDRHGNLLVPAMDMEGTIHTLQMIKLGEKRFLMGGAKAGYFCALKGTDQDAPIYITEGFATAVSVHEALGGRSSVLASFDAGNMEHVAKTVREARPYHEIIIAADNDSGLDDNVGLSKGRQAARAVSGKIIWPQFLVEDLGTDFNDMALTQGLEAVKQRLEEATDPRSTEMPADSDSLKVFKGGQDQRPVIHVRDGHLPQIVDQAEQVLITAKEQMYQREQLLVRPAFLRAGEQGDITRQEGTPVLLLLDKIFLTDRLGRVARWQKFDARKRDFKEIDAPQKVAQTLLSRTGHWKLPYLRSIVECPTLRADGSILQTPGYDSTSGLLFKPGKIFEPIPEIPTADDVMQAIRDLEDLLSTFPFEAPEDKSVALSAILTGLVRPSLPSAPLHGFSAPAAGTGKSLLADIVAMLTTGRRVSAFSQSMKEEEFAKRIDSAILQGDAIVNIDNISRPLEGDDLCQAITQSSKKIRVLGKSEMPECSCSTFFLATGNNLMLRGDMNRRALVCNLDAGVERPEERRFERNIFTFVPEHRASLVKAGLILVKEYLAQGCPDLELKPMGSFEKWSTWIRGALVWAGYTDPYVTRVRILDEDPAHEEQRNLFNAWYSTFGSMSSTLKYAISEAYRDPDSELKDALEAIAATKNGINSRKLGNWIAKHKNVIVDGLRLVRAGEYQGVAQWKMTRI